MLTTISLTLTQLFLTLLSTSFHLPNLSLLFLLVVFIFRPRAFVGLLSFTALLTYLFGHTSFGLSLILLSLIGLGFIWGKENIFPERKSVGVFLALGMVVVWEVASYLVY